MFTFKPRQFTDANMLPKISQLPLIEPLENRQLLSGTLHAAEAHAVHAAATHKAVHVAKTHTAKTHTKTSHKKTKTNNVSSTTGATGSTSTTTGTTTLPIIPFPPFPGQVQNTITYAEAPSAVENGLTSLASTGGLAIPATSQTVYLGNSNGVETYSLHYTGTGSTSTITVDQNGNPVTKPTTTTTTYSDLTTSNAIAATEIAAIAGALNLTAPTDTTTVDVTTDRSGAMTYSVHLSCGGGTAVPVAGTNSAVGPIVADGLGGGFGGFGGEISVDAAGNPVGNQRLPFDVLPAGIQSAINNNVPSGADTLATSSTQTVQVQTVDGLTLYSAAFSYTGTSTRITVNSGGTLVSLPSTTTADFSAIPQAAQDELQTLATSDGVTTAISAETSVTVYAESNGTTIYSVALSTSNSTGSTSTTAGYGDFSDTITIAVDADGNPAVPPRGGIGFGGGGGWGGGGGGPIGGPIPVLPLAFS